jgi:hypothetical protein
LFFHYPEDIDSLSDGFGWINRALVEQFGSPLHSREDGEQGVARWRMRVVAPRHEYLCGMGGGHFLFIFLSGDAA